MMLYSNHIKPWVIQEKLCKSRRRSLIYLEVVFWKEKANIVTGQNADYIREIRTKYLSQLLKSHIIQWNQNKSM